MALKNGVTDAKVSMEEIRDFVAKLSDFSRSVRSFTTKSGHGFDGGRYKVTSFLRVVLYILEKDHPSMFDEFTVGDILQWCTDENDYCG